MCRIIMVDPAQFRKRYTMAWESRAGSGRYYTRSKRVDGVVVREYIGSGAAGELVHRFDVEERLESVEQRAAFKSTQFRDGELDKTLDALVELADGVGRGLLLLAGCHQYNRGEWRKRDGKE
ncbi:MAG TPA: hypothetical protein PKN47_23395 [Nitrospira sp.]|nr:hypothetical protein [Nitrospira sp.]